MVTVSPTVLSTAAGQILDASAALAVAWQSQRAALATLSTAAAGRAAGDLPSGTGLVTDHETCAEAASAAAEALTGALEHVSDAVYTCAFTYTTTDEDTAERFRVR